MSRTANRYLIKEQDKIYNIGIYGRLSRKEKREDSLENQIAYVMSRCDSIFEDGRIVNIYREKGVTGTRMNRPVWNCLCEDIKKRKINCLAVKDLSRIGRNYIEVLEFLDYCREKQKCRVIAFDDKFDSEEMLGVEQKNMGIINILNDFYAKDYSRRIKQAKQLAKRQGQYLGSIPPFGYQIVKNENGRFLVKEVESAKYVEGLFYQFSQGINYNDLVNWLYDNRVNPIRTFHKTKKLIADDKEDLCFWSVSSIKSILTNSNYVGKIISKELFDSVQARINSVPARIDSMQGGEKRKDI